MNRTMLIGILLAGCGVKSEPTEARCSAAVSHAVDSSTSTFEVGPDRMKAAMVKHCLADRWPTAMLRCLDTTTHPTDIAMCMEKIPHEKALPIMMVMSAKPDVDDFGQRALADARRIAAVARTNDCSALAAAVEEKTGPASSTMTPEIVNAVEAKYGDQLTAIMAPAQALIEKCGTSPEVSAMTTAYEEKWSKQVVGLYQRMNEAAKTAPGCAELGNQLPGLWNQLEELQRHTPVTMDDSEVKTRLDPVMAELLAPLKPLIEKCQTDPGVKAFVADVTDGGAT